LGATPPNETGAGLDRSRDTGAARSRQHDTTGGRRRDTRPCRPRGTTRRRGDPIIPDPAERARVAVAWLADVLDLAIDAAESTPGTAERARVVAEAARTIHAGRERALAARRQAVRHAIRAGWPDSGLARATGIPQPRIAEARRRMGPEGARGRGSRQARRSARSGDVSGDGGR